MPCPEAMNRLTRIAVTSASLLFLAYFIVYQITR
jgi:hypothetical protein